MHSGIRKTIFRLSIFTVFIFTLVGIIAYARGYRYDPEGKTLTSTGIIAINSFPEAAKVYVNGEFKGATSINLSLAPGDYDIKVEKEGYTSYQKKVKLQGELVLSVDALLFPANPSLTPLTNLGVVKAVPVDHIGKIILFSDTGILEKDGIYVFERNTRPLSFFPALTLITLKSQLPVGVNFANTEVFFSPDFKEAIFDFTLENESIVSYLFSLSETEQEPFDVTLSKASLIAAWEEERAIKNRKVLESFPKDLRKVASESFRLITVSPDETKVLYQARSNTTLPRVIDPPLIASNQATEDRSLKTDEIYVYDKKEDRNYHITAVELPKKSGNPAPSPLSEKDAFPLLWYPDSKNFVIQEKDKITVLGYDNVNKQTVYSGPNEAGFLALDGEGKLVILANLNPSNNPLPDLYSVGIK